MDWKQAAICNRAARLIKVECQPGKKASAQRQAHPNTPSCRLMFTGSRRKRCGVGSLLKEHSCANVDCHQGSPSIAGPQQTPPIHTHKWWALQTPQDCSQEAPTHLCLSGLSKKALPGSPKQTFSWSLLSRPTVKSLPLETKQRQGRNKRAVSRTGKKTPIKALWYRKQ